MLQSGSVIGELSLHVKERIGLRTYIANTEVVVNLQSVQKLFFSHGRAQVRKHVQGCQAHPFAFLLKQFSMAFARSSRTPS